MTCPECGSDRLRSAKILGYEDEFWCPDCGAFTHPEDAA